MKVDFVELCGFRGYATRVRFQFGSSYTVIDGRNGAGKSSLFDAIEFALTGTISKYENASASGQTVDDYIWWRGHYPTTKEKYVEVGFSGGEGEICIRRNQANLVSGSGLKALEALLCDPQTAPEAALGQLCAHAIIRDEQITRLSLDLKETDRYALLRGSLGAMDAEKWIARAHQVSSIAKDRLEQAKRDVEAANGALATATRALDQVRANLLSETQVGEAVQRLRKLTGSSVPADQLIGRARDWLAATLTNSEKIKSVLGAWASAGALQQRVVLFQQQLSGARTAKDEAVSRLSVMPAVSEGVSSSEMSRKARAIASLVQLGKDVGYTDGHCPLCTKGQSAADFEEGLRLTLEWARSLDASAVAVGERERELEEARAQVAQCEATIAENARLLDNVQSDLGKFVADLKSAGFESNATDTALIDRLSSMEAEILDAQHQIRVLDTLRLNSELERMIRDVEGAKQRCAQTQARLGIAVTTEARAKALHDATRRAASETLEVRLERVLPLMAELYRRLRPHPVWDSIEYAIRGDVRRFLKLQVGDGLNPQFMFSSGQRRATGLAFLLSVNLSLAWSRFKTILLDDPVQHIDDFRAVHLAEVCAHLISQGRQVICAVEDEALADLFCRRWPTSGVGDARRISIGMDQDANITILSDRVLSPPPRETLVGAPKLATG